MICQDFSWFLKLSVILLRLHFFFKRGDDAFSGKKDMCSSCEDQTYIFLFVAIEIVWSGSLSNVAYCIFHGLRLHCQFLRIFYCTITFLDLIPITNSLSLCSVAPCKWKALAHWENLVKFTTTKTPTNFSFLNPNQVQWNYCWRVVLCVYCFILQVAEDLQLQPVEVH